MQAGRELDKLVERHVFGSSCEPGYMTQYSTLTEHAFRVVERMISGGWVFHLDSADNGFYCHFERADNTDDGRWGFAQASTVADAICQAAVASIAPPPQPDSVNAEG